jgi:hypothetical protein
LLDHARELQIKKLEQGHPEPPDTNLFDKQTLRDALEEVSKVRLDQTIYAEYSDAKPLILTLQGEKAEQSVDTLGVIWKLDPAATLKAINRLMEIGFLAQIGQKDNPRFKIPFLYRPHLKITQGQAGQVGGAAPDEAEED